MKRKRSLVLAAIFLVQTFLVLIGAEADCYSLAPSSRLNIPSFNQLFSAVHTGITIYKLDALGGCLKEELKAKCEAVTAGNPYLRFDIARMNLDKKGWTRYYPFSIGKESFIIRIFLTKEYSYQPVIPDKDIILKGSLKNPEVTFQVFSSINFMLKDRKIKPHTITYSQAALTCP